MKLISVQSRGDRLVRVVHYFVYGKILLNASGTGFCYECRHAPDFYSKIEALNAAEKWLQGAKQ